MQTSLVNRFLSDFFLNIHNNEQNNWDFLRFKNHHKKEGVFDPSVALHTFSFILNNIKNFELIYNQLTDPDSKNIFEKLLLFKVLGHMHIRLPQNTVQFWEEYNSINSKFLVGPSPISRKNAELNIYFLPGLNIRLIASPLTILTLFQARQYFYQRAEMICPEPGDNVIDAGSCRGDVALHFAHAVGANGQVHAFEFVPANLEIFSANLEMNPELSGRITVVEKALSRESGQRLYYEDRGPSTSLNGNISSGAATETISLDDYAKIQHLASVDFIKMDIEGSEESALLGAFQTITRFKPKLAICIYHKQDDFFRLPLIIKKMNPGYQLYIDHYTIHEEETVLYAIDKSKNAGAC
jgi:FkbM family methyltransferase